MSYSPAGGGAGWMSRYPSGHGADIAALQFLHGAANTNVENTVYDLAALAFQRGLMWTPAATTSFDASHTGCAVVLDLAEGGQSDVGAGWSLAMVPERRRDQNVTEHRASILAGSVIENGIGSNHADRIAGNLGQRTPSGGMSNDRLEGRGGDDAGRRSGPDTAVIGASRAGYSVKI
jgi:hypothetical protein